MIQIDSRRFESVVDQFTKDDDFYVRTTISDTYNLTENDIEEIRNAKRLSIVGIMRIGMSNRFIEKELWVYELLENTRCEHTFDGQVFSWKANVVSWEVKDGT